MIPVAIDFETHLISNETPSPKPVCLSFHQLGDKAGLVVGRDDMLNKLKELLDDSKYLIIAHNATFENLVIYNWFGEIRHLMQQKLERGEVFCTKIYQILINNVSRKRIENLSLSNLLKQYYKIDISELKSGGDAWRLRYAELDGVPLESWPQAAIDYAIDDSTYALRLYNTMTEMENLQWQSHVEAEFYLNLMGNTGIMIDKEKVNMLEQELLDKLGPMRQLLVDRGLAQYLTSGRFKNNLKELRSYVESKYQKGTLYTPKNVVRTDKDALPQYLGLEDDEVIRTIIEQRKYETTLSKFIKPLKAADPVIRSVYNAVMSTGRTSASSSKIYPSVNIQQMPRKVDGVTYDVRNCFIPREGFEIVSIDYSGLELCSVGHMLNKVLMRSNLRDTLNTGDTPFDTHSKFAAVLKGCSYDEFIKNKKDPEYARYRQMAKPINLGGPGGLGYLVLRGLLAEAGVFPKYQILFKHHSENYIQFLVSRNKRKNPNIRSERLSKNQYAIVYDEVVGLKDKLFTLYPELKIFLKETHKKFIHEGIIKTRNEFGEWEDEPAYGFEFMDIKRKWCTYPSFCNAYLMQTPSAKGAKKAMVDIIKTYYEDPDINPLAFIHDEIVFEVRLQSPRKYAIIDEIARMLIKNMQDVIGSVRIAVEAEAMPYWMKSGGTWSKEYWMDARGTELKSR